MSLGLSASRTRLGVFGMSLALSASRTRLGVFGMSLGLSASRTRLGVFGMSLALSASRTRLGVFASAGAGGVGGPVFECGGTPLALLHLPQAALQAVGEAATAGAPGVTTVRVSVDAAASVPPLARDLDLEVGFVCKKCRLSFPGEAALLAHQRVACYPGKAADARGAVRLVQPALECKVCGDRAGSAIDFRRHCDTDAHLSRLQSVAMPPPAASVSPSAGLSHEMEDVVNQITKLAAQNNPAAPTDSNANIAAAGKEKVDFCDAKRHSKMAVPSVGQ
uniref:C2H2-type domain-containing protein n=1 Tax=Timema shepardi TaxID=629360 RepID=A0A7R9ATV2_TIMSH|nr:unnamed protein product [Timema shepardi]